MKPNHLFLIPGMVGTITLKNNREIILGIIRIADSYIVYLTRKGLKEIYYKNMSSHQKEKACELRKLFKEEKGEVQLMGSGHIDRISISEIIEVSYF